MRLLTEVESILRLSMEEYAVSSEKELPNPEDGDILSVASELRGTLKRQRAMLEKGLEALQSSELDRERLVSSYKLEQVDAQKAYAEASLELQEVVT